MKQVMALAGVMMVLVLSPGVTRAEAPAVLRSPTQGSPVTGGPGELLLITGSGFTDTDRVVYQSAGADMPPAHPATIPTEDGAAVGVAPVVKVGSSADSITVQLPAVVDRHQAYRLWVVNKAQEWSSPVFINDPRPLWFSPAVISATQDPAGLGRKVRIVGRNLDYAGSAGLMMRLKGPTTYQFAAGRAKAGDSVAGFVREGSLPPMMLPGLYSVSLGVDGNHWQGVPGQLLEVRPDPLVPERFVVSDKRFGHCAPDDGLDDTDCLARALDAARVAGGGVVELPPGTWDLSNARRPGGIVLAPGVDIHGAGRQLTRVIRHAAKLAPMPGALLILMGRNSITGLSLTDDSAYQSSSDVRSMIQLGAAPAQEAGGSAPTVVEDVAITNNEFMKVGRALYAGGRPIRRLVVSGNRFGAFETALMLTGADAGPAGAYELEDSVIRGNTFVPGSFLDIAGRQGSIASQIAASRRVDFSDNTADGTATDGLQYPVDARGWRAGFFWSLNSSGEELLISDNVISCPGDKAGDGEAIALDYSAAAFGFEGILEVDAAGQDWVRVRIRLTHERYGRPLPEGFYKGQWLTILDGKGRGQTRKVLDYSEDRSSGTVTFSVVESWDVLPAAGQTRIGLGRQYWQVYVVGNHINQANPPCRKANLNGPRGGAITLWGPIADSVVEGNDQVDSDGIQFFQDYRAHVPSCPTCDNATTFVTALEIRNNRIDGEYDWDSDCSWSGIRGYFVATQTPESPPPTLGFAINISGNRIAHADGQRGGAIEIARAGASGPSPGTWPFSRSILIQGNDIVDIAGPPPRAACRQQQRVRAGIRIEGDHNVRDVVLSGNRCERVDKPLEDSGVATTRLCTGADAGSCECPQR